MNRKIIVRLISLLFFALIFLLKISDFYDLIAGFLVFTLLVFDLFEQNHNENLETELVYYFVWITILSIIFNVRGGYIGPFTPVFIIIIIKAVTLVLYVLKYKSIMVTRTILSKLALVSLAFYLIELIINSTHGLSTFALFFTKVSAIELLIIVLTNKIRVNYKSSVLDFLWK